MSFCLAMGDRRRRRVGTGGSGSEFDLEAPGSRFTMRPAVAIQVAREWTERSEREPAIARTALEGEFGEGWLEDDADIGEPRVLDGVRGRGAAAWIPIVEWLGLHAAGGVVSLGAGQVAREGIRRIRDRVREAKSSGHNVMASRGLAAVLAMEHVFETSDETEVLEAEFVQEPSGIGGRLPSETSYTGLEPWIVSLVNESRRTRYLLVVGPEGDIEGCITAPMGPFEAMYGLLPPTPRGGEPD